MKLVNEFTVPAPVEKVWPVLLDIARVGSCLPGAVIEPSGEDGLFRGTMKIKLGPVTTVYQGSARLQDVDEDTHTASIAVQAKEAKGQGTASAVITNRLVSENGGTRVVAETDLAITGRQAQFGRGIMQDIAGKLLGEFAARFEQELLADDRPVPAPAVAPEPGTEPPPAPVAAAGTFAEPEALDLGNVLAGSPKVRIGVAAIVLALILVLLRGKRTPKGFSADFRFRL